MQSKKSIKRENSKKENLKVKAHSGITLIALVITIIVLLILAGVALSALTGDSGILNNAESAKGKTNLANKKEQLELAVQGALIKAYAQGSKTITRDNLEEELDNIVGTDYTLSGDESPWTLTVGEYEVYISANGKITGALPKTAETTPWMPSGFSQVEGTDLSNGLTITNSTGIQNYVWIEVPTTISASVNGTTLTLANAQNDSEILEILEVYAGKGTTTNYRNGSYKDEWYDRNGNTIAADQSNKDDTAGCGMTYDEYNQTYKKMLNSIKKYGGFWLAQYEAGIAYEKEGETKATNRTGHSAITITKANYAKDQYPYNWVYCSEAQKIANADSTEEYTSSLPFGIQWDLVCKFLEVKTNLNYDDIAKNSKWGNYNNIGWTSSDNSRYSEDYGNNFKPDSKTKSSGTYILTTGAIKETSYESNKYIANPMNIYDFAGNVWEWTLEYTASTYGPCAFRGGFYYDDSTDIPAAYRLSGSTTYADNSGGFRSTLY